MILGQAFHTEKIKIIVFSLHHPQKYNLNELPGCLKQNFKMLEENMKIFMTIGVKKLFKTQRTDNIYDLYQNQTSALQNKP